MEQKGLSPMVATIVLIAMVMVIAGVLAAGISGGAPQAPASVRLTLDDVEDGSTTLTVSHSGGDSILDAWSIIENPGTGDNDNLQFNKLEIRIGGEKITGENVLSLTSEGVEQVEQGENKIDLTFAVGDTLIMENISPTMQSGDEIKVVYTPQNQLLLSTEV